MSPSQPSGFDDIDLIPSRTRYRNPDSAQKSPVRTRKKSLNVANATTLRYRRCLNKQKVARLAAQALAVLGSPIGTGRCRGASGEKRECREGSKIGFAPDIAADPTLPAPEAAETPKLPATTGTCLPASPKGTQADEYPDCGNEEWPAFPNYTGYTPGMNSLQSEMVISVG